MKNIFKPFYYLSLLFLLNNCGVKTDHPSIQTNPQTPPPSKQIIKVPFIYDNDDAIQNPHSQLKPKEWDSVHKDFEIKLNQAIHLLGYNNLEIQLPDSKVNELKNSQNLIFLVFWPTSSRYKEILDIPLIEAAIDNAGTDKNNIQYLPFKYIQNSEVSYYPTNNNQFPWIFMRSGPSLLVADANTRCLQDLAAYILTKFDIIK